MRQHSTITLSPRLNTRLSASHAAVNPTASSKAAKFKTAELRTHKNHFLAGLKYPSSPPTRTGKTYPQKPGGVALQNRWRLNISHPHRRSKTHEKQAIPTPPSHIFKRQSNPQTALPFKRTPEPTDRTSFFFSSSPLACLSPTTLLPSCRAFGLHSLALPELPTPNSQLRIMKLPAAKPIRVYSRQDLNEIDRRARDEYGIPTILLMYHAAIHLAHAVADAISNFNKDEPAPTPGLPFNSNIAFVCGPGNNGGDGYAAAKLIKDAGLSPTIITTAPPKKRTDAATFAAIARKCGIPITPFASDDGKQAIFDARIIVDCIFGTGLTRAVEGIEAQAIDFINDTSIITGAFIFATDIPSGMDCDTGKVAAVDGCIIAHATVTFIGHKRGFISNPAASKYTGKVLVRDYIGAPRELISQYGADMISRAKPRSRPRR